MRRYFFDLNESGDITRDEAGTSVLAVDDLRKIALAAARDLLSHSVKAGRLSLDGGINVRDQNGATVMTVPFFEAVVITF